MNTQYFEWGYIEWIYEPDNFLNSMYIGISTVLPNRKHNKHIHYGDEQFLYVLSGIGKQLIGDKVSMIGAGSLFHIEAGSAHETINLGNEPMVQLLISIPAFNESNIFIQNKIQNLLDIKRKSEAPIKINNEIKYIYDEIISSLKVPVSIIDKEGCFVIKGNGYPAFCDVKCNLDGNLSSCCLYGIQDSYLPPYYTEPSAFVCQHGLTVFSMPIICNDEVVGVIKGGHIRTFSNNIIIENHLVDKDVPRDQSYEAVQITSKATVTAILQQIKKLSKSIVNYYILKNTGIELNQKEEIIRDITKHEMMLEENLKSTKERVLNIQINNHFLFNTLNAIASLAIKENAHKTYESIIDLSKMFRYTLKTSNNLVEFKDEINYLRNFINLQKIRFGDRLEVEFNISSDIENTSIPFNCLQPIVENCFIHAFRGKKEGLIIQVHAKRDKDNVIIKISDNGIGLKKSDLAILNKKIKEDQKATNISGLMMIYSKLQMFYYDKFDFDIISMPNQGTSIKLTIPDKI